MADISFKYSPPITNFSVTVAEQMIKDLEDNLNTIIEDLEDSSVSTILRRGFSAQKNSNPFKNNNIINKGDLFFWIKEV